jgi:hypothetical protein
MWIWDLFDFGSWSSYGKFKIRLCNIGNRKAKPDPDQQEAKSKKLKWFFCRFLIFL